MVRAVCVGADLVKQKRSEGGRERKTGGKAEQERARKKTATERRTREEETKEFLTSQQSWTDRQFEQVH